MRNLRNILYSTWRSPVEHKERQIAAAAWDAGNDSVICAYGPSDSDTSIKLVRVDFHKGPNSM
jgi:elongator complex protein 1